MNRTCLYNTGLRPTVLVPSAVELRCISPSVCSSSRKIHELSVPVVSTNSSPHHSLNGDILDPMEPEACGCVRLGDGRLYQPGNCASCGASMRMYDSLLILAFATKLTRVGGVTTAMEQGSRGIHAPTYSRTECKLPCPFSLPDSSSYGHRSS